MSEINVWIQSFKGRKNLMLPWIDPDTGARKSQSAGTGDPVEAEKQRIRLEHDLRNGRGERGGKMSWERFVTIYQDEKLSGDSECNQSKAETVFKSFAAFAKPRTIGRITERTISLYVTKLRESGKKPAAINGYLAYMRAALRWARTQGFVSDVPKFNMPAIPKGTQKAKIRAAARITAEEFERLLMKATNRGWKLLIAFAWHCGMRRAEASAVRGEHIDLANHQIAIPRNKAKDEAATAFITPELDKFLAEMFPDGIPEGRLIYGVSHSMGEVSRGFVSIARKASVKGNSRSGHCTLHDLRRSFGSRWAGKMPAQLLQRLMRHSHITTTLTYYADVERAAMSAIWGSNVTGDVTRDPKAGKSCPRDST